MSAHTTLPLVVTKEADADGYPQHTVRTEAGGPVAVLWNYSLLEQKANAQLFATAHELLGALQHAVRFHDQLGPHDIKRFNSVIAKAMGKEGAST